LSYAIGVAEPLAIFITTYGTGVRPDKQLLKIVEENFDLRPGKIVQYVQHSATSSCLFANKKLVVYMHSLPGSKIGELKRLVFFSFPPKFPVIRQQGAYFDLRCKSQNILGVSQGRI